eukprot:IDg15811t1
MAVNRQPALVIERHWECVFLTMQNTYCECDRSMSGAGSPSKRWQMRDMALGATR